MFNDRNFVSLVDTPIDTQAMLAAASRRDCGAVLLFLGTTREWTGDAQTMQLEYDAYREMAVQQLQSLAEQALDRWPIKRIAVTHRLGIVPVSEASVAIVISSPHRQAAFEVGAWYLEQLKQVVPIWKCDYAGDGSKAWQHPTATEASTATRGAL
jgi:molybdopterin synthase catalytic subunit